MKKEDNWTITLVGICGKAGHGKDTLAKELFFILNEEYLGDTHQNVNTNVKLHTLGFANSVKGACSEVFGTPNHLEASLPIEKNAPSDVSSKEIKHLGGPERILTNREVWQEFGTTLRNVFGEDIWINSVMRQVEFVHFNYNTISRKYHTIVIIPDLRFKNEAEWITKNNGLIVKVVNENLIAKDNHVSETEGDHITPNVIVDNSGTLDELHTQALTCCEVIAMRAYEISGINLIQ